MAVDALFVVPAPVRALRRPLLEFLFPPVDADYPAPFAVA